MKRSNWVRRTLAMFMAAVLVLSAGSALAAEEKTLTVSASAEGTSDYNGPTAIQDAIRYIEGQTDKDGWTIILEDGEYNRFNVGKKTPNLTVKGGKGAVISVMDGTASPTGAGDDAGGINFQTAAGFTLEGVTLKAGGQKKNWTYAMITNFGNSGGGNGITVKDCDFTGTAGRGILISSGCAKFTVDGCTFAETVGTAVEVMNDGTPVAQEGSFVTNNTFNKNDYALHGYWGGKGSGGTLTMTGNTLTGKGSGADTKRCKIIIQDDGNKGNVIPAISGNTITNGLVGLVNIKDDGVLARDVLEANTVDEGTFGVDGIEPGTIEFYSSYQAKQGGYRYGTWQSTGLNNTDWTDEQKAAVQTAIDEANANQADVLNITGLPDGTLIHTFTRFKDAIYWTPYENGKLTVKKTVEGEAEEGRKFAFTVTLTGEGIPEGEQVYGGVTFTGGVAEFELGKDESLTIEGIPVGVSYEVAEEAADGYTTKMENATGEILADEEAVVSVTNASPITITVTKVWDDEDDKDSLRPDSIIVNLLADGEATDYECELDEAGKWTYTFEDLPKYSEEGKEIVYSVKEEAVEGYEEPVIEGKDGVFTITNTHVPETEPETEPTTEPEEIPDETVPLAPPTEEETETETESEEDTTAAPTTTAEEIEENDVPLAPPTVTPVTPTQPTRIPMDHGYEEIIDDEVPQALPVTGQVHWPILVLAIAGVVMLGAAAIIRRRQKTEG